jgi:hypothetical protein
MPKERAILLAVPSGRIAKGELNLGKERMTLVMAPSPPATRIRSVGSLRHFLYRPCFIEQAVTVYPASRRKADKTWAVWLPVPAVGCGSRGRACAPSDRLAKIERACRGLQISSLASRSTCTTQGGGVFR